MMKYVVEMDLLPLEMTRRKIPITRRVLIEAESISAALLLVEKEFAPGQDCVSIRIFELES